MNEAITKDERRMNEAERRNFEAASKNDRRNDESKLSLCLFSTFYKPSIVGFGLEKLRGLFISQQNSLIYGKLKSSTGINTVEDVLIH